MPFYYSIKKMPPPMRSRCLAGLKRLRRQLDREMPQKTRTATLVLGTWNIRNFDDNRFATGHRTGEDLLYIAEIISRFDVVAVQELCNDLRPLKKVIRILGDAYDYIVTDMSEGSAGNKERLGFIYDRSKVSFRGVAGELVLPPKLLISSGEQKLQFSRTPFMCSFQSGWFKFNFSTVHIFFGKDTGPKYQKRVAEIDAVAKFLANRAKRDAKLRGVAENHILVGDFNIKLPGSDGYNALEKNGFEIFQNKKGSNKKQNKFYDQISFLVKENDLRFVESDKNKGVFQQFSSIFRPQDFPEYKDDLHRIVRLKIKKSETALARAKKRLDKATTAKKLASANKAIEKANKSITKWDNHLTDDTLMKIYYEEKWRTFHASDHLPLWVELEIDFSGDYLDGLTK